MDRPRRRAALWPTRRRNGTPPPPPRNRTATAALVGLMFLAVVYTLVLAQSLIFPLILAVLLTCLVEPVVQIFTRWYIPRSASAALFVGLALLLVGFAGSYLVEPARNWIEEAPEKLREVEWQLRSIKRPIEEITEASEKIAEVDDGADDAARVKINPPGITGRLLSYTGQFTAGVVLTVVTFYFLLTWGKTVLTNVVRATRSDAEEVDDLVSHIEREVGYYLLTVTFINACLGAAIGTALWLLDLPNPVLWGVMAAALNFIPFLGALVGTIIVFFVALLSFDSATQALAAPALYMGINSLEGYLVTPTVLGRSIQLNPLMVFLSVVAWGWMWGVGGALIAVPVLAAVKIVADHSRRFSAVGALIGR